MACNAASKLTDARSTIIPKALYWYCSLVVLLLITGEAFDLIRFKTDPCSRFIGPIAVRHRPPKSPDGPPPSVSISIAIAVFPCRSWKYSVPNPQCPLPVWPPPMLDLLPLISQRLPSCNVF